MIRASVERATALPTVDVPDAANAKMNMEQFEATKQGEVDSDFKLTLPSSFSALQTPAARLHIKAEPPKVKVAAADMVLVPREPSEAMWKGLARDIIMWLDLDQGRTPRGLIEHLASCGREVPQWLRDEPEMLSIDHAISKGTRAVLIYKAMLAAAPQQQTEGKA